MNTNIIDTFNSMNPLEQCEWLIDLIYNQTEQEVEKVYKELEEDKEKSKVLKSLFSIMIDLDKDFKTDTVKLINDMYPIWLQQLKQYEI